jgi:lytic murein transglycosylase
MDLLDSQAEFTKPVWEYIDGIVTDDRIARGRALLEQHREIFDAVEKAYGVDRFIVAAIWGVETNYGQAKDSRSVVRSTATLACVGRRQGYYREEFISVLDILQHGDIPAAQLNGNWAGAFGGTQFMPTSFRRFAVDFDKDGKRDLMGSISDALASTANFLKFSGWTPGHRWGFEVKLPENFNYLLSNGPRRSIRAWGELGVTLADGSSMPQDAEIAYLVLPAGAAGPAFLGLDNFGSILSYNPAESYALTVALLADRLRGQGALAKSWPRGDRMLTTAERVELQGRLQQRGYFIVGAPTGRIDPSTRRAVQKFQVVSGLTPDGNISAAVLDRLRKQ